MVKKGDIIKGEGYEGKVIRINKKSYVVEFYKHPLTKLGGNLISTIAF